MTTILQEKTIIKKEEAVLFIAFELSNSKWKLCFSNGERRRQKTIDARDLVQLSLEIPKAKEKFGYETCRIISCYEAGRDGFWLHRYLKKSGIENIVIDSSSIEVNRRARRAKTDRIDVESLICLLERYGRGEKPFSVVNVPGAEEEDQRRLHRERERLIKERIGHSNRISSLLILHGIKVELGKVDFLKQLETLRTGDGNYLGSGLKEELKRQYERYELTNKQIKGLEVWQKELIERSKKEETESESLKKVVQLMELKSIGPISAWVMVMEGLGWRQYKNRKEVAASVGLTPTPYSSGDSQREQGISKSGNRRMRTLLIELSWMWLRNQPDSKLSLWFNERFGGGGKRMRRIGIVAMARRLFIDLWRYLEHGLIPEGAVLK